MFLFRGKKHKKGKNKPKSATQAEMEVEVSEGISVDPGGTESGSASSGIVKNISDFSWQLQNLEIRNFRVQKWLTVG